MLIKNLTVCCSFRKTYFADRYREIFLRIFLFSLTKIILLSFFFFNILNSGYPSKFILAKFLRFGHLQKSIPEKLDSGRMVWTFGLQTLGLGTLRLWTTGSLDSGRLGSKRLDSKRLGLWKTGRLDSGQLNASNYRLTVPSSDYILKWLYQECFLGNFPKAFGAPKHHRL